MGRTKRKGGSRKRGGGLFDAIAATTMDTAALISKAAKEAADKAKSMAVKAHHETIKGIDRGTQAFEQTAHAGIAHAKNVADKASAAASVAAGKAETSANTAVQTHMGGRHRRTHKSKHRRKRKTHKRKHRRKRKTHKRKHRRKRKTHRRHH